MSGFSKDQSNALFRSVIEAAPLIEDLPEGSTFAIDSLVVPDLAKPLDSRQKLGYLYEDTFAEMLQASPLHELVGRGIQLRKEASHTLGELDFLVKDLQTSRLIHLEIAVKFYLSVELKGRFFLPGPDARDSYLRKLERMRFHQLILIRKYRERLPERFRDKEIEVQQLVQGCIFEHVKASRPVEAEFLNPNGRRGKWIHVDDCMRYFGRNARLYVIPKALWPVPMNILVGFELEKWEFDENMDRCVMVMTPQGDQPFFIVPKSYPNLYS